MKMPADIVNMLKESKQVKQTAIEMPTLDGRQVVNDPSGVPLSILGMSLGISDLAKCFTEYWRMNVDRARLAEDADRVGRYRSHYYNAMIAPVPQFQGEGEVVHAVRWMGKEGHRRRGKARADWIWVRL